MVFDESVIGVKADRTVIPSGCLSFSENALYIAEATENEFNKLFESVGIDELAFFESTGSEVIYEGAKLDEFKKKAVEFFKGILAKIKHGYEIIVDKFNEIVKGNKKNLEKLKLSDLDVLDADATFGKLHNFDFGGASARESAHKLATEIKDTFDKEQTKTKDAAKSLVEKYQTRIVGEISGTGKETIKEAKDELKQRYNGDTFDVDLNWLKKNFEDLHYCTFESPIKEIKTSFNEEKATIDTVIKQVKDYKSDDVSYARATISLLRDVITTMHQCTAVRLDAMKRRQTEYRNVYTKVYVAVSKANKGKTAKHESVNIEDVVESCFDW